MKKILLQAKIHLLVFTLQLLLLTQTETVVYAQAGARQQPRPFFPIKIRIKPDHDSTQSVTNLSPAQRSALIDRLYKTDQRYRSELHSGKSRTAEQRRLLEQLLNPNDEANAAILFKLVNTYGWPRPRFENDSTEWKAYFIVWHISTFDSYRRFEPFLPEKIRHVRLVHPPLSLAEKWKGWR